MSGSVRLDAETYNMYVLLLILGVLLIVLGAMTLIRSTRAGNPPVSSIVWGIILIVLGIIALPGGFYLRG